VAFGGLEVLSGVELEVRRGESVGLIGPNGAGKSTLFDCISGFTVPRAGSIHYRGHDLLRLPPEARARLGIARTFQHVGLCGNQTIRENALIAQHDAARYGVLPGLLRTPAMRRTERDLARQAAVALDIVGVAGIADHRVRDLPHGQQRLAEVAAAVAAAPDLLLLDEPAAGMDPDESRHLGDLLARLRDELGLTLLVIDHHVPFVTSLCDYVYVLVEGRVLTHGSPVEVRADPAVVEVYLGSPAAAKEAAHV
jgi:branched-chain amino acid transport system ATP-binding protein